MDELGRGRKKKCSQAVRTLTPHPSPHPHAPPLTFNALSSSSFPFRSRCVRAKRARFKSGSDVRAWFFFKKMYIFFRICRTPAVLPSLPEDVLIRIVEFLDPSELGIMSHVCRALWHAARQAAAAALTISPQAVAVSATRVHWAADFYPRMVEEHM